MTLCGTLPYVSAAGNFARFTSAARVIAEGAWPGRLTRRLVMRSLLPYCPAPHTNNCQGTDTAHAKRGTFARDRRNWNEAIFRADDTDVQTKCAVHSGERLLNMARRAWKRKVDRHLLGNCWDRTWRQMEEFIKRAPTHRQDIHFPTETAHV